MHFLGKNQFNVRSNRQRFVENHRTFKLNFSLGAKNLICLSYFVYFLLRLICNHSFFYSLRRTHTGLTFSQRNMKLNRGSRKKKKRILKEISTKQNMLLKGEKKNRGKIFKVVHPREKEMQWARISINKQNTHSHKEFIRKVDKIMGK